jgi:hypothetical protein
MSAPGRTGPASAVLWALLAVGCARSDDPTAPQPEKVYRDAFETPLATVEIEADGGTIVGSYDAWLRLLPAGSLVARDESHYRPVDCRPLRGYFAPKLALDGLSANLDSWRCREYRNRRLPFENGRWLAEDVVDGRVYYRIWKFR